MRKITVIVVLFGLSCLNSMAQGEYKLDTIFRTGDTLISFNSINNIEIKYAETKKDVKKVYINNKLIDSIRAIIFDLPILFDSHIYINALFQPGADPYKKICILNNGELKYYSEKFRYDNGLKQVYNRKDFVKIYLYNPITKSERLYCDFSDVVQWTSSDGKNYPEETIDYIYFVSSKTAYVKICYYGPFASCWKSRHFMVTENGEKHEITSKMEYASKEKIENYSSTISFTSNGFIRESIHLEVIENKAYKHIYKNRLFDDNFNFISEVLYFEPKIIGVNIQNNTVQYYYLRSTTQNNVEVIIPYKFIPQLDLAMYKAYNNIILTQEDIKTLGKYELGILRNLIFAKHNYDFSSEFYQAYFNLYEFYNKEEMKKTRTKEVNSKLTDADKANIELIRRIEKNL